jgi:hypothetical protein
MKVTKDMQGEILFRPYIINIHVEDQLEHQTLRSMASANIRIPDAVFLDGSEFAASSGSRKVCKDLLGRIASAMDG